jgi:hypothetical protein
MGLPWEANLDPTLALPVGDRGPIDQAAICEQERARAPHRGFLLTATA